uniref:Uncharacterized protein n=1 Tax=Athene cunicularia TaxID=194338 RepID=A0A663N823_ATHCN
EFFIVLLNFRGWIKCLSHTEDISKPGFSLNAAVEGQQNNSVGQEAFGRNSVKTACHVSLSAINRRNVYGETLLHKAVTHQDVHLVPNIIKAGGNVNVQDYAGWTPLHKASVKGFYGIANELLKAGADVNARGNEQITPLQDAVEEGHYKMKECLVEEVEQKALKKMEKKEMQSPVCFHSLPKQNTSKQKE